MRPTLILGAILLAAFALRVHLLGAQELRGDEGFTWNYVQKDPVEIAATIIREGDPQPPLHYWLQWAWLGLTGDSEFAMRAWSAFLSLLLVPLMYQVGRRLWRREVGLLAAGLTAVHPQQIWLAQDVRNMYQLALIALLVATVLLKQLLEAGGTRTRVYWAGYVLCAVTAMYSHYYALFFLFAHGAYAALHPARRIARWITAGLATAALVAPWALVILPVYLGGQLRDPGRLSFAAYASAGLGDLAAGPAFPDTVKLAVTLAAALLAGAGLATLIARGLPHVAALSFASIAITVTGIYLVIATRATFNTFYLSFAAPAAYLLLAGGAFALYRWVRPVGAGLVLLTLVVCGLGLRNHYVDPAYSKDRGMRQIAGYLAQSARPDDVYLTSTPDPAMVYYLRGLNLPFHLVPSHPDFDPAQVDAELDALLSGRAGRVWMVPARALDPEGYVRARLLDTALLAEDLPFNKLRLMLFLPLAEAVPIEARFEGGIRLTGYHLTPNRLTLIWTADSAPDLDYTIFVHALADDTFQLTGHDAPPRLPTSQWTPGQRVVDVHEFEIPTGQPVTLVAGLYLPASPQDPLPLEAGPEGAPEAALITRIAP